MTELACAACKRSYEPARFFEGLSGFTPALEVARWTCPDCKAMSELRIEPGAVWFGYLSAAGAPHFTAVDRVPIPELRVSSSNDSLTIELGDLSFRCELDR